MAENEVVFRQYNERVEEGFAELKRMAEEEGQESLLDDDNSTLHFYCECSDEDCRQRVQLEPSRYKDIHIRRDRFVVVCGHENETIERVVEKTPDYCVIEKLMSPPTVATSLHDTGTDNS